MFLYIGKLADPWSSKGEEISNSNPQKKVVHEVDQVPLAYSCFPHLSMYSKCKKHMPLLT